MLRKCCMWCEMQQGSGFWGECLRFARVKARILSAEREPCRAGHEMHGKRRMGSPFRGELRRFAGRKAAAAPEPTLQRAVKSDLRPPTRAARKNAGAWADVAGRSTTTTRQFRRTAGVLASCCSMTHVVRQSLRRLPGLSNCGRHTARRGGPTLPFNAPLNRIAPAVRIAASPAAGVRLPTLD
jgi:hypothetical protein